MSEAQRRFLDDALESVRRQTYRDADLLIVEWGPGTDHADIAGARADGLDRAGGRFARLIEAADILPWHSTALLVRALAGRPDAGTAAGRSIRAGGWREAAFAAAPGVEAGLGDRLIDLGRWRASGIGFDAHHGRFADATLTRCDLELGCVRIETTTHEDLDRQQGLPFSHLRRWAAEIHEWLPAVETALPAASAEWAVSVLDTRLPAVLADVESLREQHWRRLVAVAAGLLERAGQTVGDRVRVESRVLAWLTGQGNRDRVTELVLSRWRAPDDFATTVRDGRVYADFGVAEVPEDVLVLGERETPLSLLPQRRTRDRLDLVGFIHGVENREPPQVRASYAGRPVRVTSTASAAATRFAGEAEHDHEHAWLCTDLGGLPRTGLLEVELTARDVTRSGTVDVPAVLDPAPEADPRGDDEIGPHAQLLLQRWYADQGPAGPGPIQPDLAYFQAYAGKQATDSPLAIHRALRASHPQIRVRWLVEDLSIPVPEGAEAVLLRSREWYRTLATARWLVTNIEMEPWFRRRPGQDLCQTYHGLPGKSMGMSSWRHIGLTPGRIEQVRAHTVQAWTLLLTGDPAMTHFYREQFGYDGAVFEHGYPRDDVLVGPQAATIRERTRAVLGIGEGQIAVLYAPTWRDQSATNFRRARLHEGFDVPAAAAALGPGYVLLLRGHRFHKDLDVTGARVVDVTAYPEVNDLILAADAAVLDYSSIRFDFALTDRPMVFCVPDLEDYSRRRGFLYDFTQTAPGPLLDTTDEVVAVLRDLPALTREYAEARARFRERFGSAQDGHSAEAVVAAFFGTQER